MIALLAAMIMAAAPAAVPPPASPIPPLVSLQVVTDGPAMIAVIRDDANGRTLAIDCVEPCSGPPHFAEPFDDTPLGLFQPFDREPIIVAVTAGGSVYHVRAYRLTATKITRVLDVATRAAPGFAVSDGGAIVVTTTERRGESAGPGDDRRVTWRWRDGRFNRSEAGAASNTPQKHD